MPFTPKSKTMSDASVSMEATEEALQRTIHQALYREDAQLLSRVSQLLSAGADADAANNSIDGCTPLEGVMSHAHYKVVPPMVLEMMSLLLRAGANPNKRSSPGALPLLMQAVDGNNPEIVALLLQHGANVHTSSQGPPRLEQAMKRRGYSQGYSLTALHVAAYYHYDRIIHQLLRAGASPLAFALDPPDKKKPLPRALRLRTRNPPDRGKPLPCVLPNVARTPMWYYLCGYWKSGDRTGSSKDERILSSMAEAACLRDSNELIRIYKAMPPPPHPVDSRGTGFLQSLLYRCVGQALDAKERLSSITLAPSESWKNDQNYSVWDLCMEEKEGRLQKLEEAAYTNSTNVSEKLQAALGKTSEPSARGSRQKNEYPFFLERLQRLHEEVVRLQSSKRTVDSAKYDQREGLDEACGGSPTPPPLPELPVRSEIHDSCNFPLPNAPQGSWGALFPAKVERRAPSSSFPNKSGPQEGAHALEDLIDDLEDLLKEPQLSP